MTDTIEDKVARYVELADAERETKARLDAIKAERIPLEAAILDHWGNNGITGQRVRGLTVYPQRMVFASAPLEAIEAAGLHELIGVNSQRLSAYVREHEASGEPLPQPLADAVTLTEKISLRTRKGS